MPYGHMLPREKQFKSVSTPCVFSAQAANFPDVAKQLLYLLTKWKRSVLRAAAVNEIRPQANEQKKHTQSTSQTGTEAK